jgi:hypothetical protein
MSQGRKTRSVRNRFSDAREVLLAHLTHLRSRRTMLVVTMSDGPLKTAFHGHAYRVQEDCTVLQMYGSMATSPGTPGEGSGNGHGTDNLPVCHKEASAYCPKGII